MNSPILRMATSTDACRSGFFAAGLTVAAVAVVQTFSTLLSWVVMSVL